MSKSKSSENIDDISFLNSDRLKKSEEKLETGEITCNVESPDDCESCSG